MAILLFILLFHLLEFLLKVGAFIFKVCNRLLVSGNLILHDYNVPVEGIREEFVLVNGFLVLAENFGIPCSNCKYSK